MDPSSSLFEGILNITSPWLLKEIIVRDHIKVIDIYIGFERGAHFYCPSCGTLCKAHDSIMYRIRHLDICDYRLYLNISKPRTNCNRCGVKTLKRTPWSNTSSHYSNKFEYLIISLIKEMSVSAVGRELGEPDNNLWRVFNHHVKNIINDFNFEAVKHVCVDETASKRGHKYISIFSDYDTGNVLFVTEGRSEEVFGLFYGFLWDHGGHPGNIEMFSMDMSVPYQAGKNAYFSHSEISFDRFHIKKMLNEAIDKVRREEVKKEEKLKNTKYLWMKNEANLTGRQKDQLNLFLSEMTLNTAKAYMLKNQFDQVWKVQINAVEPLLEEWTRNALSLNMSQIDRFVGTLKRHYWGIVKSIKTGVTNALAEGLNSIIQLARSRAKGFRNVNNYINMAYFLGAN